MLQSTLSLAARIVAAALPESFLGKGTVEKKNADNIAITNKAIIM